MSSDPRIIPLFRMNAFSFFSIIKIYANIHKIEVRKYFVKRRIILLLPIRVSLVRPAPYELPQDRNVARVLGCSGAI